MPGVQSQVVIIVLSAITPVILLTDAAVLPFLADDGRRRLIAAILSAMVAIVAGLNNAFRWGEEWVRSAYYREALTSERYKFLTAATAEYAGEERAAIAAFARKLGDMRMADAMEFKDAKKSDIADSLAVQKELAKNLDTQGKPPGAV